MLKLSVLFYFLFCIVCLKARTDNEFHIEASREKECRVCFLLELPLISSVCSLLRSVPLPNEKNAARKATAGFEQEPMQWAKRLHMEPTNHGTMKDITDLKLCMVKPKS